MLMSVKQQPSEIVYVKKEPRMRNRNVVVTAVFLILIMAPLIGHAAMLPRGVVKFTGQEIRGDQQTGLIVFPSKGMPFITVGSPYHDFSLLLPYSESWELESGTEVALFAKDKHYIASVNIGISPIGTPRGYYEKFLENMDKSGEVERQKTEIIKTPNTKKPILRYQSRRAILPERLQHMNRWVWNYWVAVQYGSEWYALHLSVTSEDEERLRREEDKIMFALDSFSPGNFKKKKADEPSTRTHKGNMFQYKNPQYGELHFIVPESWKSVHEKSVEKQTETIIFC